MRKSWYGVLVTVVIVLLTGIAVADDGWIGREAPGFSMEDASGKTIDIAALKGKVIWINFWGLRCGPCVRELPALQSIYERYSDQGLLIVGVNADGVDAEFINNSFQQREDLKAANVSFPLLPDTEFALVDAYELMGAPLNVMIDREGKIQFYHEGYENGDEKHYEEVVKKLLAQ